ncbi:MAG: Ig-like domain-containing protein [Acetatifactor sp.]|nr:Ig-like domain-containing protein [Acetatifactor sp.]
MTMSSRKKSKRDDTDDAEDAGDRILDRFILIAGVAVLLMAIVTGAVFVSLRLRNSQAESYQQVGAQLAGVNLIGGQGLQAVANAQQTYNATLLAQATPEPVPTQPPESYNEQEYRPDINVQMNFSSIEKDLKIKFVNKETGKLISNVPFSITITDPNGVEVMWSDDDMDGIIYKKNLTPGQYRLVMNTLTDEKYKSYGLITTEQKTEVKKEIEYKKVDVSDEVKTESQINVAKEDTKINETIVESYLQDTVAWVESTSTMITYAEVAKSNIPDPMTLAASSSFVRLSQDNSETGELPSTETPVSTEAPATPPPTEAPATPAPTEAPATPPPTEAPATPAPTAEPTATPAPTASPTPMPVYVGRIDPSSKTLKVGESFTVSASCEGVTIQSITWTSSNSSAVTVDGNGTVTAVAATQQPVLISYAASGVDGAGGAVGGLTASCSVTVTAVKNLKLDKATELVYTGAAINLTATLENGLDTDVLTVESSDGNVAKAEISGRTITVTGLGAGTANITVKYTENGNTISAVCTVTVKQNPRENRTSLLKDKDGNELYVQENNTYRQAYYADYYTFDRFFKKGEARYTGWQTIGGAVKYFDINGNAVTGEQVIQGVKYNFASDGALLTGAGVMGIDVSKHNGVIDWNAVKNSGVSYVIIRCGYRGSSLGGLIVDPMFHTNIKGATDAGLKVGVYFFTQAVDRVEAVEEASMVLDLIKNYRISYPVFLDVESSGGRADGISRETRTEVCKAFCQTIQNGGYTAGIYANKTWLNEKIDPGQLGAYKIWLAQYASTPTYTGRYEMWQYKSTGRVSGISGDVDLNLSYLGY